MSGPYDQHYAFANNGYAYQDQYQYQQYPQSSSYPAEGFSQQPYHQPQNYYPDTRSAGANTSYYGPSGAAADSPHNTNAHQGSEADRGLLGAVGGGAAGAWGGHKAGHGVLGALGGAILGSLTEDYAKKHKKQGKQPKPHKQYKNSHNNGSYYARNSSDAGTVSNNSKMSALGPIASSLFNGKH